MKKTALFFLFILILISLTPERTFAVAASPYPVQVVQPDGSTITIRIHGDEFLNWATCGERLVSRGSDGFFYYADFKADGSKELSGVRAVYNNIALLDQTLTSVRPPAAAIEKARLARAAAHATLIRTKANKELVKDPEPFATGSGTFLVILVEFQDTKFTNASPQQAFYNLLNQEGYNVNGATGSANDYYFDNSRGDFDPQFVVAGPVTAKYNSAYYSGDVLTSYIRDLVVEAANAVDSQVNFAQFDHDGDGYVDNIFIFFAGRGQNDSEDPTTIWPHAWSLNSPYPNLDGKRVYRYACASELKTNKADYTTRFTGIGTFCHEFGHVLGLPDFYDTDYEENGQANGLGYYSLMDTGNYSNYGNTPPYLTCMERYLLGWMTDSDITSLGTSGFYQLAPVQNDVAYTSS
ncbi:MAG: M6 family metalloprotease domain-containing protein, partial [Bacteroidales bacterium]